jgi:hypothetical protein
MLREQLFQLLNTFGHFVKSYPVFFLDLAEVKEEFEGWLGSLGCSGSWWASWVALGAAGWCGSWGSFCFVGISAGGGCFVALGEPGFEVFGGFLDLGVSFVGSWGIQDGSVPVVPGEEGSGVRTLVVIGELGQFFGSGPGEFGGDGCHLICLLIGVGLP